MPKMKTHSGAKKRLSVAKSGKIKKTMANRAHKLSCKSSKRKLSLKRDAFIQSANAKAAKKLLPYG